MDIWCKLQNVIKINDLKAVTSKQWFCVTKERMK